MTDCGLIILCLNRSPSGNIPLFFLNIEDLMNKLRNRSKCTIVLGDFNINFGINNSTQKDKLLNLFTSYNLEATVANITMYGDGCETISHQMFINKQTCNSDVEVADKKHASVKYIEMRRIKKVAI
ncbi:uncharacterized protein LOC124596477 [Schistocerca americana]|uniref:uncharacterized protein LOC124596477 n=1 Tax=Schistocerca americana TaxID=7009 RepID=UPI001F50067F|nr:uncharacterized protein LOC124596477 [Schistocerca americana]